MIENIQLVGGKSNDAVRNGQETQQRNNNGGGMSFSDEIPFGCDY